MYEELEDGEIVYRNWALQSCSFLPGVFLLPPSFPLHPPLFLCLCSSTPLHLSPLLSTSLHSSLLPFVPFHLPPLISTFVPLHFHPFLSASLNSHPFPSISTSSHLPTHLLLLSLPFPPLLYDLFIAPLLRFLVTSFTCKRPSIL